MGQNNEEKVTWLFYENPSERFYLRQIARLTKVPKSTVQRLLPKLIKEGLITKEGSKPVDYYRANTTNFYYKLNKRNAMILKIYQSGLVEYIRNKLNPECIILFGSISKGEYDHKSDIDIFVQAEETSVKLEKFETKLKHKINLFFETSFKNLSKELFNNIINGYKLEGFIRLE